MIQALLPSTNSVIRHIATALVVRALALRHTQLIVLALLAVPSAAQACSVCFGDPESPMMKGAAAGVYVMIGVIGFVLVGIAGTACFWLVRCRRMAAGLPADRMNSCS